MPAAVLLSHSLMIQTVAVFSAEWSAVRQPQVGYTEPQWP
jgi:hypothetical protein